MYIYIYTYIHIHMHIYIYIHTYFNRFWLDWIAWILTFCGIGLLLETLGHRTRYKQVSNLFVLVLWLWLKHKGILGYGKRKTKVGMQILLYRFLHFMHVLYVFLRTLDGWNCKIGCSSTTNPGYVHMDVEYVVHSIPVVPARGGAEVALKIYIRPFSSIELACAVRQPSPCVRALCESGVLFHMSHLKLHFALHASHSTLHTPHFTLHSSHSTLHLIWALLTLSQLISSHLISSHMSPKLSWITSQYYY